MGSLTGQRDPGGTMYMRNRYYDPATGQFTQPDPIGIGGGLNTYGFAAGDSVGNWDPFGTCAWGIGPDAAFGRCSGMEPQDRYQDFSPLDTSISSECKYDRLCAPYVRWASVDTALIVRSTIRRRLSTIGFCGEIRQAALDAVSRGLAVIPDNLGYVGEAPWAYPPYPRPGPLMFLGRSQLRNGHAIAHEALHGMTNGARNYVHTDMTPMGKDFHATVWDCSRGA